MTALRTDLLASLRGTPDAVDFAGSIADARCALKRIEDHAFAAAAYGNECGEGTNARIEAVALGLAQLVLARRARA